jgi:hypothetical protein
MAKTPLSAYSDDDLLLSLSLRAWGSFIDEPMKRALAVVAGYQREVQTVLPLRHIKTLSLLIAQELRGKEVS